MERGRNFGTVIFASSRPLGRCENITAVWTAYDGPKIFALIGPTGRCDDVHNAEKDGYSVIVTDEFFSTDIVGKNRVKVVLIGHGMPGGKLYGLDQPRPYHTRRRAAQIDWIVAPGAPELVARQSGVSRDQVLLLGMPRTDIYFDEDGRTRPRPHDDDLTRYLYVPTFRAGWEPRRPDIPWASLDAMLQRDERLIVKPHMMDGMRLPEGLSKIVFANPDEPTTEYLLDADVVVTDFSSIMFDATVISTPVVLFTPTKEDRDGYLKARGMYHPYPYWYSPFYTDDPELLVPLCRRVTEMDRDEVLGGYDEELVNTSMSHVTGDGAERVVRLIKDLIRKEWRESICTSRR